MEVLKAGLSLMENTKSVQPLNAVGKRLEENSNPVRVRKWFDGSFHARNQRWTTAAGYAEQKGQNNARGEKRLIFLHIAQHAISVLCALTQISCQWDRREAETSKERLSSWYLKPIQKHQKSLIKAWLLCVLLSPFAYWESYFVSFSFCDSNLFTSSSSLLLTVSSSARISHILALCIKGNCIGLI